MQKHWGKRMGWSVLLGVIATVVLLGFRQSTHQGPWVLGQTQLPEVTVVANRYFQVNHLRDFRYDSSGEIRSADLRQSTYDIDLLQDVWLGVSHFSGMGLAHAFVSFGFADGQYLAVSFEARLRPEQEYSPMKGMLNQYPKMLVLGTEADIIGLRSHIRVERVLLYRLQLNEEQQAYLFRGLMADVTDILEKPRFYNTLLDNCVTSLLRHDPEHSIWTGLLDYRVLLPGFGDGFAQEKGWISDELTLDQLREQARVDGTISPESLNYSELIRVRE
ncbi:lipoprotein N-acyltransferase Lnb domain-containing protein [Nitrincola iocasae]|uniref:DUF4105 domain-containing protein n=1 Tax=Nitrincola iocasae TaxID=2614693 RepID=A0A5J6LFP6_9GAMM|nr:DUF4105 domain-containing protein [Nitrincola iocasae]QEW07213.1 DUF4105 domain-containing protein [Nitrincola iocasae]